MILLVCSALLILFAKLYHPKKFSFFLSLPFNSGVKEFEEEFNPNGVRDPFDVLLTLNSYIVFGCGVFIILSPTLGEPLFFARIIFVLFLFFLGKSFAEIFLGWLFDNAEGIAAAQNTSLAYRCWSAIWILPVIVLAVYIPGVLDIVRDLLLLILLGAYLLSLLLSGLRLWNLVGGTYYKILYLCALELIPFFFLVYWFKSL